MNTVKILVEGYAKETDNGWKASSTVTWVKSGNKNIIVDPGCNRKKLLEKLAENNLKTSDIDFVLLTHSHADHSLLAGIFENAKVLTTEEIYNNDNQIEHNNEIPGTDLKIIQTPGHCPEQCSLIITTKDGIYGIVGDVFWWADDEKQRIDINKKDEAHIKEVDMKNLIKSRKMVLKLVDYIVPGHGKMFKVKK